MSLEYNALMMNRNLLVELYERKGLSVSTIASRFQCSEHKVDYWIKKFGIKKRSLSEALYKKWNPKGDPFSVSTPRTIGEGILYGLGVGLYWGEGTKANKNAVRLGNTDPRLIRKFIAFLQKFYGIDMKRLRLGLQVFGDMRPSQAIGFWTKFLRVPRKQFLPTIVITPHRGVGNYRQKTRHGVLTLYFNNKKLRDILCNAIEEESMR